MYKIITLPIGSYIYDQLDNMYLDKEVENSEMITNILPTVVSSILSRRSAIATMTRTSFLDSLVSWKYAPILVRDIYSAAFPMIVFI